MITWAAAIFLAVAFVAALRVLRLPAAGKTVADISRRCLEVIRSTGMDDEAKAAALQGHAGQLFLLFGKITVGCALAVFAPLGVVWLCSLLKIVSLESVLAAAFSPGFILASCGLAAIAFSPGSGQRRESDRYSGLDKLLHHIAFKTYAAHLPLADIETRMFAGELAACSGDRPVFITAMPRAGTTLMLECCAGLPDFASHCYRDMPFILTPCLWSRFSSAFKKEAGRSWQRAHGDGMLITLDSPEALEEVIWKTFWPRQYRADRITPWANQDHPDFQEFFTAHMRKIILLRRGADAPPARYLSKNNFNIARIPLLRRMFPDSVIIIPFREPLGHASSLVEQHRNFLGIHRQDPFAAAYMLGIGHFDFGRNLRPVDFHGWLDQRTGKDALQLDFWLEYWIAGYEYLLAARESTVHFFNYETFCQAPGASLRILGEAIAARQPERLVGAAADIRPVRQRTIATEAIPPRLLHKAAAVYERLQLAALN